MNYEEVRLMHEVKTYPPRVKMTVESEGASDVFIIPVKIDGCAKDGELDTELIFRPQGMYYIVQLT